MSNHLPLLLPFEFQLENRLTNSANAQYMKLPVFTDHRARVPQTVMILLFLYASASAQRVTWIDLKPPPPAPDGWVNSFIFDMLNAERSGVLMSGKMRTEQYRLQKTRREIPFVLECDGTGKVGSIRLLPDTSRFRAFSTPDWTDTSDRVQTRAIRDGVDRILVAWSMQTVLHDYRTDWHIPDWLQMPTLSVGVFEKDTFRLIARYENCSDPRLCRDASGIVHLIGVRHHPKRVVHRAEYCDYSGDIVYARFRDGVPLDTPIVIGRGMRPSVASDERGMIHVLSIEYDSIPSPVNRVLHISKRTAAWEVQDTLFEEPARISWGRRITVENLPEAIAFSADSAGVARAVITYGYGVYAACATGKKTVRLDSLFGNSISLKVDGLVRSTGTIALLCTDEYYLYLCTIDADLAQATIDTLNHAYPTKCVRLVESKQYGLCAFFSVQEFLNLLARVGEGPRALQRLFPGGYYDWSYPVDPRVQAVADSVGAIWAPYHYWGGDPDKKFGLVLVPPGAVGARELDAPDVFSLSCFPNPANEDATLNFTLPSVQHATITVHDLLGREVLRAANARRFERGANMVVLKVAELSPGVYVVRVAARDGVVTTVLSVR